MARKPARVPSGARISDHVTLGVLTATVPAALIDAVLAGKRTDTVGEIAGRRKGSVALSRAL